MIEVMEIGHAARIAFGGGGVRPVEPPIELGIAIEALHLAEMHRKAEAVVSRDRRGGRPHCRECLGASGRR